MWRIFFRGRRCASAVSAIWKACLGDGERKNGWQVAECVGDTSPYGMQYLLGRARWEADELQSRLSRYVKDELGSPEAVLILDETGFLKKGVHFSRSTATVQRHGRTNRKQPDRRVSLLRSQARLCARGSRVISSSAVGGGSRTLPGRRHSRRGPFSDQADAGPADAGAGVSGGSTLRLGGR